MSGVDRIRQELSEALKTSVTLEPMGRNTYRLVAPFEFEDGDTIVAFLEIAGDRVKFTDRGHTLMHVSYDVEVTAASRRRVLTRALATHALEYNEGVISTEAPISDIGAAFWDFVQGLVRVSDLAQWKIERAASLFFEEFEEFMVGQIKPHVPRVQKDWHDVKVDEAGFYRIPWVCQNGKEPLFVFPILGTQDCDQAVISCLKYENVSYDYGSMAVFSDIDKVRSRSRNQVIDIGTKTVTGFDAQRKVRAKKFILDYFQ